MTNTHSGWLRALKIDSELTSVDIGADAFAVMNPLRGQSLAVPHEARIDNGPDGVARLEWRWPGRSGFGEGSPTTGALWAFVRLADEMNPAAFAAFALKYGVLGLWEYRTPDGHKTYRGWVPSICCGHLPPIVGSGELLPDRADAGQREWQWLWEPLDGWRLWAGSARAALRVAYALRTGILPSADDWSGLWSVSEMLRSDIAWQQTLLAQLVTTSWLRYSGLVPRLRWDDALGVAGPVMTLGLGGSFGQGAGSTVSPWPENSLFPVLAAQLVAAISAGANLAACSMCGTIHERSRKPRPDRPHYCEQCQPEARRRVERESARRTRARKKAQESRRQN